jgi:hypothetical protein
MKLIYCTQCKDIVLLHARERKCYCGESSGRYLDELNAEYSGPCLMLGIDNGSLYDAVQLHKKHPDGELGIRFEAFIIPETAATVKRKESDDKKVQSAAASG